MQRCIVDEAGHDAALPSSWRKLHDSSLASLTEPENTVKANHSSSKLHNVGLVATPSEDVIGYRIGAVCLQRLDRYRRAAIDACNLILTPAISFFFCKRLFERARVLEIHFLSLLTFALCMRD